MNKILDGKILAEKIQSNLRKEISDQHLTPDLAVILVGQDPASQLYVSKKKTASKDVGINFHEYLLDASVEENQILQTIDFLNKDEDIDAILVQLPLPEKFDTDKIIKAINPKKDVDGFHPQNIKDFLKDKAHITPGLPLGILRLIEETKEDIKGKEVVIVSKSPVFCEPMSKILNDRKTKISIVTPQDKNLGAITSRADILIVSCGQPFLIKENMVKKDAIVIDVGTNKIDKNYIVGDVDYSNVFPKAKFITPVPGGVGPMTVAMLLYNTVKLAKLKK